MNRAHANRQGRRVSHRRGWVATLLLHVRTFGVRVGGLGLELAQALGLGHDLHAHRGRRAKADHFPHTVR